MTVPPVFRHAWPVAQPHGVVYVVHGALEHGGRYAPTALWLNQLGYSVFADDLPGWGQSAGRRGHIAHFDQYVDVVEQGVAQIAAQYPHLPLILLAHSMGGLVLLRYAQTRILPPAVRGLVLSSPALALRGSRTLKASIGRHLAHCLPLLALDTGVRPWHVSRSQQKMHIVASDPLTATKATLAWFRAFEQAIAAAWAEPRAIPVPLLLLVAGQDQLLFADQLARFLDTPRAVAQQLAQFPTLYHEVLDEPEHEEVRAVIADWLHFMEPTPLEHAQ